MKIKNFYNTMASEKVKYRPLKSYDFDECDSDAGSENQAPIQRQIHCSIKLLLVVFIVTQMIYVGRYSDFQIFHRNTSLLNDSSNDVEGKQLNVVEKLTTNREILRSTDYDENYEIRNTISTWNPLNADDVIEGGDPSLVTTNSSTLASTTSARLRTIQSGINQTIFGTLTDTRTGIINDAETSSNRSRNNNNNNYTNSGSSGNSVSSSSSGSTTGNNFNTSTNHVSTNNNNTTTINVKAIDDYDDADLKDAIKIQQQKNTNENEIVKNSHETQNILTNTSINHNYLNKHTTTIIKRTTTMITKTFNTASHLVSLNPENTTSAKGIYYSTSRPTIAIKHTSSASPISHTSNLNYTSSNTPINPNNPNHHTNTNIIKSKSPMKRPYFINTTTCHIPFTDPFSTEVRKIFKPPHNKGCAKDPAIVSVSFDATKTQYVLHINYAVAKTLIKTPKDNAVETDLSCCYRQIERSGSGYMADKMFTLLPCTKFHQDFLVPRHIQGVIINCSSKSKKKLLQEDAFAFIQVNHTKDNELVGSSWNTLKANGPQNLGVLMIGIDALSRINLRRNMPQVVKHLQDNGWYELRGYNKVGDNTFPNLMPLLVGLTKTSSLSKCKPKSVGGLDECNFVWRKFSKHGFKTAYAEDAVQLSTFDYQLKGFLRPPTDHYYRPIALAIEKTMKKTTLASLNYCIGRKQAGEYVCDYAMEFATRYQNHSNFGFFWTNSFSHNSFLTASTMDARMLQYFKDFKLKGIMEQSVVIFLSDHGQRWGPLLQLPEGFLEERLPFLFISLPEWLKKKYPAYVQSLEINQKRLVTPFDIYMTLQDLLHMAVPEYKVVQAEDCSNAQSIFSVIPENRTCLDACIPDAWCTCIPYVIVSRKDATVQRVTHLVVDEMNRYLARKNLTSQCSNLTLREISKAQMRVTDESEAAKPSIYVIEFVTNPKTDPTTIFSATASYDSSHDSVQLNVEDIARHSKYEKTAQCTNDKQAKLYCICRDSLKLQ